MSPVISAAVQRKRKFLRDARHFHDRLSNLKNGLWLSLVERLNGVQEVPGSNPGSPMLLRKRELQGFLRSKKQGFKILPPHNCPYSDVSVLHKKHLPPSSWEGFSAKMGRLRPVKTSRLKTGSRPLQPTRGGLKPPACSRPGNTRGV